MLWIYRILYIPLLLLAGPFYLRRMWKRGGYRKDFRNRLGLLSPPEPTDHRPRIWLQAVSVGEVLAAKPLIESLNAALDIDWVLTCTTSTAYGVAQRELHSSVSMIGYFPLDFWLFSRLAWNRIQPDLALLMESELWPEHLQQAKRRQVPVILVNARLSDRSFRRYRKLRWGAQRLATRHLHSVLSGSEQDATRFREIDPNLRVTPGGNLKLTAAPLSVPPPEKKESLLGRIFGATHQGKPVLIGASTWPGEELFLLDLLQRTFDQGSPFRLILVPRHAERGDEIATLLEQRKWAFSWRSRNLPSSGPTPDTAIHLADTTGELKQLLTVCDVAFIGKSLPPHHEGQTPVEAALQGIPAVYGPGMENFREICAALESAGAALACQSVAQTAERLIELLSDPQRRAEVKKAASVWSESNRGGLRKTTEEVLSILRCSRKPGSYPDQSPPHSCGPEERSERSC